MGVSRNLFHYLDCTAMDFEQMQKIWDEEKKENFFVINEDAMRKTVTSKKRVANRDVNVTEIGLMIINTITATILLTRALIDSKAWPSYLGVGIMLFTVFYLMYIRRKRKKADLTFDRTMLGELDHAIANVKSTIAIGRTMIYWYILPIGIFSIVKMTIQGAAIEKWLFVLVAFALGHFVSNLGVKKQHIPRLEKLQQLKAKLTEEA